MSFGLPPIPLRLGLVVLGLVLAATTAAASEDWRNPFLDGDSALYPEPIALEEIARAGTLRPNPSMQAISGDTASLGRSENKGVRIELLQLIRSDELAGTRAPEGMEAVILVTRWQNIHPPQAVARAQLKSSGDRSFGAGSLLGGGGKSKASDMVEIDVAYQVRQPVQHIWLMTGGESHALRSESAALPAGLDPRATFSLPRFGESREVRLGWFVPRDSRDPALRFFDYDNGHISLPAAANSAAAAQPVARPIDSGSLGELELEVLGSRFSDHWGDARAPEGWRYLQVELRGRSLATQAGKGALVHADPTRFLWVQSDGGVLRYGEADADGAAGLVFTPELPHRQTVAFLVPEKTDAFRIGIRGRSAVLTLRATAADASAVVPATSNISDGTALKLGLSGMRWDGQTLVADLQATPAVGGKGVELDSAQQFLIKTASADFRPDSALSARLYRQVPDPFVLPPGTAVRFELAFSLPQDVEPTALHFRGFSGEYTLEVDATAISGTRGRDAGHFAKAPPPIAVAPDRAKAATPANGVELGSEQDPPLENVGQAGNLTDPDATAEETVRASEPASFVPSNTPPEMMPVELGVFDPASAGAEAEPNNTPEQANSFGASRAAVGKLAADDAVDWFMFDVGGEPELWALEASGPGAQRLAVQAAGGRTLIERDRRSQPGVRIDYLQLMPGRYWVAVKASSAGGDYQVRAVSLGRPNRESEFEPNDHLSQAQLIRFGEARRGLIAQQDDLDLYRFSLDRPTAVALQLAPPPDQQLALKIEGVGLRVSGSKTAGAGEASDYQALLQPGDYTLTVYSERWTPGHSPYRLQLDYRDPFALPIDLEPNDNAAQAVVLDDRRSIRGNVGAFGREDWYRLPEVSVPTALTLQTSGRNSFNLRRVENGTVQYGKLVQDTATGPETGHRYAATLDPGVVNYVQVGGSGEYEIDLGLQPEPPGEHTPGATTGLELKGPASLPDFAAFHPDRQQAALTFTLNNSSTTTQQVHLDFAPAMAGWSISAAPLELAPGQSTTVKATLSADAGRAPATALPLFVAARSDNATSATLTLPVNASCAAPAVSPQPAQPLPPALLGGIDVAWQALGAEQLADAATRSKQALLFDGMTPLRQRLHIDASALPMDITVKLAGQGALAIAGISLYPGPAQGAQVGTVPFSVQASIDGATFNEIYRGHLTAAETEQAFEFDRAVTATHMRLHLENSAALQDGVDVVLAEFKVLAAPGANVFAEQPPNLADPVLGGHIVWASWPGQDHVELHAMLTEASEGRTSDIERMQALEWVIGFQHQRAARITRLEWSDRNVTNASYRRPEQVALAASVEGPNGPWKPLGTWTLTRSADGLAALDLPAAPWARYLRFSVPGADIRSRWQLVETLRVFEQAQDAQYRSILGEWGHYASAASYEQQLTTQDVQSVDAGGASAAQARLLASGKAVRGQASAGQREDWFRVQIPAGLDRVEFRLGGDGSSRLLPELHASDGNTIALTEIDDEAGERVFQATVQPGAEYRLKVAEANRSIMIVWDNSTSVREYHDGMYQAIARFADEIRPGLEVLNLMPLRDGNAQPLLPEWTSNPVEIKAAIGAYKRSDDSSDAERTLISATELLAARPGNRAILLLTDAESPGDREAARLWQRLREVRPRVFTLELQLNADTAKVAHYQDLMQNWAQVNHGDYRVFRNQNDLDRAFERAACLLRSAAEYSVSWGPAPGEGELRVAWEQGKAMAGASMELILDASGSMRSGNSRIGGKLKMEVAREALQAIITSLPDDTRVGLRFYGHRVREGSKGDCEDSQLMAPIAPLDRARLSAEVGKVQALGTTPIAYSIARACEDLARIDGHKLLVLITDGKEECRGDPAAAVAACRANGLDVRVDIVGFALSDAADKADMLSAAEQGDGRFFDAQDGEALTAAIQESLAMPFDVFDSREQSIANGLTGHQGLSLYQGNYSVVIRTAAGEVTVRDVAVREKQTTTITLARDADGIRAETRVGTQP